MLYLLVAIPPGLRRLRQLVLLDIKKNKKGPKEARGLGDQPPVYRENEPDTTSLAIMTSATRQLVEGCLRRRILMIPPTSSVAQQKRAGWRRGPKDEVVCGERKMAMDLGPDDQDFVRRTNMLGLQLE